MNLYDLTQLIENGENSYVEFKNYNVSANELAITAFANYEGGFILLGVEKDGHISLVLRGTLVNACPCTEKL